VYLFDDPHFVFSLSIGKYRLYTFLSQTCISQFSRAKPKIQINSQLQSDTAFRISNTSDRTLNR